MLPAPRGLKDRLDQLALTAQFPGQPDRPVHRVFPDQPGPRALIVPFPDPLDLKAFKVPLVTPVLRESKDRPVLTVPFPDPLDRPVPKAFKGILVPKAFKVRSVQPVLTVRSPDPSVLRESAVFKVFRAFKVRSVQPGRPDRKAFKGHLGKKALLVS